MRRGLGLGADYPTRITNSSYTYPLDEWPTDVLYAFSMRLLREAYTGSCMRVRRDSDNTEMDIPFMGTYVDWNAILTFVGTGPTNNGFVVTWYDQSPNATNKTQSTALEQPYIVMAGTFNQNMINGKIALYCPAGSPDRGLTNSFASPPANQSMAFHTWRVEGEALPAVVTGGFYGVMQSGNASSATSNMGSPTYYKDQVSLGGPTRDGLYTGFLNDFALMSVINIDMNPYTSISSKFPGFRGITGLNFEEIVYGTQTEPRADIEGNIRAYYGI